MRARFLAVALAACSSDGMSGGPDAGPPNPFAIACADTPDGVYTLPGGLPAYGPSHRGDPIRCAYLMTLSKAQVQSSLAAQGYTGTSVTSGVAVYRVAYRTDRHSTGVVEGTTGALVFLPDTPRATGAQPVVVAAHGTVGVADKCAPSATDPTRQAMNLGLAGRGWTVIAPDYAGYHFGQRSPGYLDAEDEGHSVLDGGRAMQKLVPAGALSGDVVLVGHSQGGHAVLAAQTLAASYGVTLKGVVAFAPFWLSGKVWGAALNPGAGLSTNGTPTLLNYMNMVFYSQGELYDGPSHGQDPFQAAKKALMQTLYGTLCSSESEARLTELGTITTDYVDQTFVDDVGGCALSGTNCSAGPAPTWMPHLHAVRPAISASGAPILFLAGGMDTTLDPNKQKCGLDRIAADLGGSLSSVLQTCADMGATHGSIILRDMDYASAWIAWKTLGVAPPPGSCMPFDAVFPGANCSVLNAD